MKQQDKPKSEEKYKNVDNTLVIFTVILTNACVGTVTAKATLIKPGKYEDEDCQKIT